MRRSWIVLGSTLVLAGATVAGARGQESDAPRPDPAVVSARELVERLAGQAEAQRAQLCQTETSLERARELLGQLERRSRDQDPSLVELRDEEARAERQLQSIRTLARRSSDPALVRHQG